MDRRKTGIKLYETTKRDLCSKDAVEAPFVDWYVLNAEALEPKSDEISSEGVEIGLKQLFLPWMEEKPLMLVVISEELEMKE